MTMYRTFILICGYTLLCQLSSVSCTGQFFVSVLNYSRPDVGCCPDNNTSNGGPCLEDCQLLFNIEVQGLNGSSKSSKRLSEDPINLSQAKSDQGMPNPIAFMFNKWPGELNVTMTVLHMSPLYAVGGSGMVVDTFHTYINFNGDSTFYFPLSIGHGGKMNNESMVTIVYRYGCNPTKGPTCFSDCVDHDKSEKCPTITARPNGPTIVLNCITADGNETENNCTVLTPTPPTRSHETTTKDYLTTTEALTNSTSMQQNDTKTTPPPTETMGKHATTTEGFLMTTEALTNSTSMQPNDTKTPPYRDPGPTPVPSNTDNSNNPSSTTTIVATTSNPKTTTTTSTTEKISSTESPLISAEHKDTTPTPTNKISTPSERYEFIDEKMTYWPVIVGCVLGGIALFAAAGYFIYWNRQKKMRKRQEIYNVNPKILRNFEEYEENGTSGRADVPLETEQY